MGTLWRAKCPDPAKDPRTVTTSAAPARGPCGPLVPDSRSNEVAHRTDDDRCGRRGAPRDLLLCCAGRAEVMLLSRRSRGTEATIRRGLRARRGMSSARPSHALTLARATPYIRADRPLSLPQAVDGLIFRLFERAWAAVLELYSMRHALSRPRMPSECY